MSSFFDLPFEEDPDPACAEAPASKPDTAEASASAVPASTDTPLGEPAQPEPRRVLTVSQLTARIRTLLEEQFFEVWVEGELSNCRVWTSGHMYFTLKDRGAQIKGVMFGSALRLLRFKPQDGLRVVARGRVSVYGPKGEYQIACEHLEP